MARKKISSTQAVCITLLWGVLCYLLLAYGGATFKNIFILAASAIIVFVPVYKSFRKDGHKD